MEDPIIGIGATYCIGSDRYAGTIVYVSANKGLIRVRDDHAIRTDDNGMSDAQEYKYEPNEEGEVRTFYRNRLGGYGNKRRGGYCAVGVRDHHHDYSF